MNFHSFSAGPSRHRRPLEVKAEPKPRLSAIMAAVKELNSIPFDDVYDAPDGWWDGEISW